MDASKIDDLDIAVFAVPTERPEADGTLTWDKTVAVTVQARAAGTTGLGWTYGTGACAAVVRDLLAPTVVGRDPMDATGIWADMVKAIRNQGRPGIVSMAIAAVDTALWDLKARLLGLPLARLLGLVRAEVPLYGSGGFTSLSDQELVEQLAGWARRDTSPGSR